MFGYNSINLLLIYVEASLVYLVTRVGVLLGFVVRSLCKLIGDVDLPTSI